MNVDIYHISIHISIFISVNIHLSIWTSSIGLCQCAVLAVTPVRLCTSFPYGKNKLFIIILLSIWTLKCHIQPYIHMFMNIRISIWTSMNVRHICHISIHISIYLWTSHIFIWTSINIDLCHLSIHISIYIYEHIYICEHIIM